MTGTAIGLAVSVFLACAVEGVEALTIVLAVGTTRSWRATFTGLGAALVALAIITAALGPALTAIPLGVLRVIVGGLLLIFGLQWLRKAILRASGLKALHDEDAIFERQVAEAEDQAPLDDQWDPYSFLIAFKGCFLEGLEVVFIALTFGANQHDVPLAAMAALVAVATVAIAGLLVSAPLSQVPENTMKFVVGVMLTSFGIFWGGEGAHANWPGGDAALAVVVPLVALFSLGLVSMIRRQNLAVGAA
ncbi:MAG: hypothetical protein J2O48_01325 [Solirubrobacterales bacterium]|nr:hypothetical protein [Solirubrobacterales bacterium]